MIPVTLRDNLIFGCLLACLMLMGLPGPTPGHCLEAGSQRGTGLEGFRHCHAPCAEQLAAADPCGRGMARSGPCAPCLDPLLSPLLSGQKHFPDGKNQSPSTHAGKPFARAGRGESTAAGRGPLAVRLCASSPLRHLRTVVLLN